MRNKRGIVLELFEAFLVPFFLGSLKFLPPSFHLSTI